MQHILHDGIVQIYKIQVRLINILVFNRNKI